MQPPYLPKNSRNVSYGTLVVPRTLRHLGRPLSWVSMEKLNTGEHSFTPLILETFFASLWRAAQLFASQKAEANRVKPYGCRYGTKPRLQPATITKVRKFIFPMLHTTMNL